jgi:hypothetical protein
MSFNAIFQDFCQQSTRAGHPFACRITRSMTNPTECGTPEAAWLPSNEQPEPKYLGDFLKLLGQKIVSGSSTGVIHLCSIVVVGSLPTSLNFSHTMAAVESAMNFSPRVWGESHRGGELSRYGSWPMDVTSDESFLRLALDFEKNPRADSNDSPEETAARIADLEKQLDDKRQARADISWLRKQAIRILDLKWCAVDRVQISKPHQSDWMSWKRDLPEHWSLELQQIVLLYAAMVSCQVPLSAADWASEHFLPVLVKFKTQVVLGLLSKYAAIEKFKSDSRAGMICVGRHPAEGPLGKDLVLADGATKMPVGLVPDFLALLRTDEEFVDRVTELYSTLNPTVTPRGAMFPYIPLDAISVSAK